MWQIYHFFVNRNEFVVPDCLRQYLGLTPIRCSRHDFLPMMNNLYIYIVVITLREVSATNSIEEQFWRILSIEKNKIDRHLLSSWWSFYLGGFNCSQIKSNSILLTSQCCKGGLDIAEGQRQGN